MCGWTTSYAYSTDEFRAGVLEKSAVLECPVEISSVAVDDQLERGVGGLQLLHEIPHGCGRSLCLGGHIGLYDFFFDFGQGWPDCLRLPLVLFVRW